MQREVKCLYKLMLKEHGKVTNLKGIFAFYKDYDKLVSLVKNNAHVPGVGLGIQYYFPKIKIPKYLQWVKNYMPKRKKK